MSGQPVSLHLPEEVHAAIEDMAQQPDPTTSRRAGRLPPETPGLRATGAAPAQRGGAVGAPEGSHEVNRVAVADPPADLLDC